MQESPLQYYRRRVRGFNADLEYWKGNTVAQIGSLSFKEAADKLQQAIEEIEDIEIDHGSNKESAANTSYAINKVLEILRGKQL